MCKCASVCVTMCTCARRSEGCCECVHARERVSESGNRSVCACVCVYGHKIIPRMLLGEGNRAKTERSDSQRGQAVGKHSLVVTGRTRKETRPLG